MAIREIELVTCDRCGNEEKVEVKYEFVVTPIPHTWLNIDGFGHLCPECAKQFREFATEFFGDNVPRGWALKGEKDE